MIIIRNAFRMRMMLNSMRTVTTVLLSFIAMTAFAQDADCDLKRDDDGILVYTCKSQNERFKSIRATFTIAHTTIEELLIFLKQIDHYPTWQYNMVSAKLLKPVSEDTLIVRTEIKAPWPVDNRELIVEYAFSYLQDTNKLRVTTRTVSFEYPTSKNLVRVPFSYAEWDVTAVEDSLQVTYSMKIDPGGSVPAWVLNMAMAEGPHHTFTNLKKQLE